MLRLILTTLLVVTLASPSWAQGSDPADLGNPGSAAEKVDPDNDDDLFEDDDDDLFDDDDDDLYDDDLFDEEQPGEDPTQHDDVTPQEGDASGAATADDEAIAQDGVGLSEEDVRKSVGIEEIMVTSQRRRSTLQDVPVSVTAFTASEIEAQGIQDIKGISDYTPNLEIKTAFAASNPTLFIRGVGLNDYNANAASSVAVYQDEVYMNSPAGQLFQFFDVQGVEVLRGPQGSLYGRNASAGAIRVQSVEPGEDFDVTGTLTYGRFNEVEIESAIGGPLVDGLVSGRAAIHFRRRDGTVKNRCVFDQPTPTDQCGIKTGSVLARRFPYIPADLPRRLNDVNNWAARGLLRVTPDVLDMDWLFNIHGGQNLSQTTALYHAANRETPFGFTNRQEYPAEEFPNDDPWAGHYSRVGFEYLDTLGASARGKMQFGNDTTFSTITAYESADRSVTDDFDSSPTAASHNDTNDKSWQFSEEVRLDWQAADSLSMTFGGMYLKADLDADNLFKVNGVRLDALGLDTEGKRFYQSYQQDINTFGVYGHFLWNFLDDFSLEGGVRYSWERKTFAIQGAVQDGDIGCPRANDPTGLCTKPPGTPPYLAQRPIQDIAESLQVATFSAPTGDISLSYRLTEDATLYGKYSRGWKPGGFNGTVVTGAGSCSLEDCPLTEPIRPESVDGYEIGLKSYWFDRRLMFNAAMFFQKYQDLQVFVLENSNLTGAPLPKLINANDAQIYGFEAEIWARPLPGLDIRTQFGWLESEYLDFTRNFFRQNSSRPPAPPTIQQAQADFSGNRLAANPRFSFSGNLGYEIPLGETNGYLTPGFSWTFKSLTYFDPTEGEDRTGTAVYRKQWSGNTFLGQPAYWLLNARLSYTTPDERLEISAWVRNITNQAYSIDAFSNLEVNGSVVRVIGEPRTFGLTLWVSY